MTLISPLRRWTRDDWVIPCTVLDPSDQPVNLTGKTIGAELWVAGYSVFSPLTVANGGIIRVSDPTGQFTVVVPRLLTAKAPPDAGRLGSDHRTRVLIYEVNTLGRRQTLGVLPFEVFDGSEGLAIDEVADTKIVYENTSLTLVVASSQGPAGPSAIAAAQISDGGDVGRQIVQASTAEAVRSLLSLTSFGRHAVSDINYSAQAADTYVAYAALTAPRTITLPMADSYPPGQPLWIADETGACSTGSPIIIAAAGADTIAGQPNVLLASPYQKLALHSNGTNLWTM